MCLRSGPAFGQPWFLALYYSTDLRSGLDCESISNHTTVMKQLTVLIALTAWITTLGSHAALPPDYHGKPFEDAVYKGGPQVIPGRVECAYYDLGGEGVAYHDTDSTNNGSGVLNQQKNHQRPHAAPYHWNFRANEGVDISYTKDFADFIHQQNLVNPLTNQFYIGWTEDGEWCNYTVDVKKAGAYRIVALYGNAANTFSFSVNNQPACECKFPVPTGSMHKWNKAEVGQITFSEAGPQLLTLHYNKGNNLAYFEFEAINPGESRSALETDPKGWADILPPADLQGWYRVPVPPTGKLGRDQWHVDAEKHVLICDGDGGHDMLLFNQEIGDAIFHFEFCYTRIEGKTGYNSGGYVRNSKDGAIWHQAQFGDAKDGYLFGVTPIADGKTKFFNLAKQVKDMRVKPAGEWNTFEVTARGSTLVLWVNGAVTCQFDGCGLPRGFVGLEGEGYRIEFRNLKVKPLP